MRVCSVPGCPELYPSSEGSRCIEHRRAADRRRGSATQRGYNSSGHQAFRNEVLERDPICVQCELRQSTVADHYPHSRKELINLGLDPNNPTRGRGLCAPCHSLETAAHQPGGFAQM